MEFQGIALRREPGWMSRSFIAFTLRLALGLLFLLMGYTKYVDLKKHRDAQTEHEATLLKAGKTVSDADKLPFNPKAYPGYMIATFANNRFKDNILSPERVELFAKILPYAEIGVGAALIAGLFTTIGAFLSGLLLVALLFGKIVLALDDPAKIKDLPEMYIYLMVNAGILWLSPVTSNYLSLDGLFFGWFWRPKSEGDFTAN